MAEAHTDPTKVAVKKLQNVSDDKVENKDEKTQEMAKDSLTKEITVGVYY